MVELNESNFEQETKEGVVLVDFYTPTCPPCRLLAPVLEECQSFVKVCKVDGAVHHALAERFNVRRVPVLILMKDGVELRRSEGFSPKEKIQQFVEG